eukprot:gene16982-biopygen3831
MKIAECEGGLPAGGTADTTMLALPPESIPRPSRARKTPHLPCTLGHGWLALWGALEAAGPVTRRAARVHFRSMGCPGGGGGGEAWCGSWLQAAVEALQRASRVAVITRVASVCGCHSQYSKKSEKTRRRL